MTGLESSEARTTLSSVTYDLDLDKIDSSLPWMIQSYLSKLEPYQPDQLLDLDLQNAFIDNKNDIDSILSYFSKLEPVLEAYSDHSYSVYNQPIMCFKCPFCGLAVSKIGFKSHLILHYEIRCNSCYQSFSSETALRRHQNSEDSCSKPFICGVCFRTFRWKYQMLQHKNSHQKIQFKKESLFTCDICLGTYSNLKDLKLHEEQDHNIHSEIQNYPSTSHLPSEIKVSDAVTKEQRSKKIILEKR